MQTKFKKVEHEDVGIIISMMQKFYAIDGYPIDVEVSQKLLSEFIENENLGIAWVIMFESKVVGYCILTFIFSFEYQGKIAFVDELYLSENARGKGIGTETIEFIKLKAAELMLKLLYLEVENHNTTAQKLYLSAGFEIHNRKFMRYKINTN